MARICSVVFNAQVARNNGLGFMQSLARTPQLGFSCTVARNHRVGFRGGMARRAFLEFTCSLARILNVVFKLLLARRFLFLLGLLVVVAPHSLCVPVSLLHKVAEWVILLAVAILSTRQVESV